MELVGKRNLRYEKELKDIFSNLLDIFKIDPI